MNLDDVMQAINAQQNEQLRAATRQLADVVSDYYGNLIMRDVPADQAAALAGALQVWILQNSKSEQGGV